MTLPKLLFLFVDKSFDRTQNRRKKFSFLDDTVTVTKDIVYDEKNKESCTLDTYYVKKNEGKYPVFFYIHGGGFVAGDKHYRRAMSAWAAKQGFFVVNVNYALAPEYKFPTAIYNLVDALNWVGANAEKYNLDIDNMMVSGDSAGGYYSALLSTLALNKELQNKLNCHTDLKFRGAVLNCGIYDVGQALAKYIPFNLTDKICYDFAGVHKKGFETYEWKEICAPIDLITKDFPVSFVTYAGKDIFCKGQGPLLIEKLKSLGIHVEEFHSTKLLQNHCFSLNWKGKVPEENNRLTEDFIRRFLAKEI